MKKIFLICLGFLLAGHVLAQEPLLRHEMTPEEQLRKSEIGRGFVETDPPASPVRNVAEFERMQGALIRYPFGIPFSLIKEMAQDVTVTTIVASNSQKNTVIGQYIANGVDTSHCDFLIAPSNSYWSRDFGPWFESDSAGQIGIIDFPYNRPRPDDDEIPKLFAQMLGIPWYGMNVISTGGNYMTDGFGIGASTDLVYVENPTQTAVQVDQKMLDYLGISDFQVVPDPNISTTIDHIDCWSKFLAPDKILIRKTLPSDPEYSALESAATYWTAKICSYGYPFKVFRVMTPQDQPYTNSVILNNKVLVPIMNSTWDDSALAVYRNAMPGYEVIGFTGNPTTPWLSTDALHCRVMGVADIGLLRITHLPIYGDQPCETPYLVQADIVASSMTPIVADSARIRYRVNGGAYQTVLLQHLAGKTYQGFIPKQPAGSIVEYYLTASDGSGRSETMPIMGAADPYLFRTIHTNLAATPDTLWFLTAADCLNGKITQLRNFLTTPLSLDEVQQNGTGLPWWVDSMSVASLPSMVNAGDSVAVRVKMILPVHSNPLVIWDIDSLQYDTPVGRQYVMIMFNHDLMTGISASGHELATGAAFPNPFTMQTSVPVHLEVPQTVHSEIIDIHGHLVKKYDPLKWDKGAHFISWDGTDLNDQTAPAGIYLLRLRTDAQTAVIRLVLIR